MKYSVIIPIYNAAATIGRCLDSLLRQPHDAVEILVVNDGSSDESGEICRRYARDHACIRYFEKENGGVSSARNLGLEKAAGEYILFVDSDDYVAADYFAVINQVITRQDPDIMLFGLGCFGARDDVWQTGNFFAEQEVEIATFVRAASLAYLYSSTTSKLFRRNIILENNLRFDENLLIGEDQAFIFAYTMHIKRIASIENVLYHYAIENRNSLSQKPRPYLTEQLLRMNLLMQDALNRSGHSGQVRQIYQEAVSWSHYRSAYSACKELNKFNLTPSERRVRIRQICSSFSKAGIPLVGLRTRVIALPVIVKMSRVIDGMSHYRENHRK